MCFPPHGSCLHASCLAWIPSATSPTGYPWYTTIPSLTTLSPRSSLSLTTPRLYPYCFRIGRCYDLDYLATNYAPVAHAFIHPSSIHNPPSPSSRHRDILQRLVGLLRGPDGNLTGMRQRQALYVTLQVRDTTFVSFLFCALAYYILPSHGNTRDPAGDSIRPATHTPWTYCSHHMNKANNRPSSKPYPLYSIHARTSLPPRHCFPNGLNPAISLEDNGYACPAQRLRSTWPASNVTPESIDG